MKTATIGMISLLTLAAAAYAGPTEGKDLFASKCQGCHGASGEGKAAIAKAYKVTMRPLGSKEVQARSDAELKHVITVGQGKMKAVSSLNDNQAADVVAYVRTLKQ